MPQQPVEIFKKGWKNLAEFNPKNPQRSDESEEGIRRVAEFKPDTYLFNAITKHEVIPFHYIFFDGIPLCVVKDRVYRMVPTGSPSLGYDLQEVVIDKKRFLKDPFFITEIEALDALFRKIIPQPKNKKKKAEPEKPNFYSGAPLSF